MKILWALVFLFSPLHEVMAQAQAGSASVVTQKQNMLEQMVQSDPQLKQILNKCYDDKAEDIAKCLWEGIPQDKQNQITAALEQNAPDQDTQSPGASLNQFTNKKDSLNQKALDKLSSFYSKRLAKELGTDDGKRIVINEQNTFYDLAEVQLGKNVMTAWSSLCIDMEWKGGKMYSKDKEEERKKIREKNLKQLQATNDSKLYTQCVAHIPLLCREAKGKPKLSDDADPPTVDYTKEGYQLSGYSSDDLSYSRRRACEVYAYVSGVQKQLQATETISKRFKDALAKENQGYNGANLADHLNRKGVKVDDVTTITSGDVASEGGYYAGIKENEELLKQCQTNPNSNPACRDLLVAEDEIEELRSTGAAMMIETKAMQELIKKANDDEAKKKIIQQLRPDLDINEIDVKQEFEKISQQYKNEREHLIASLSKRVQELEAKPDSSENNIKTAASQLLSRGNEYIQLMHYNNIVTGFLTVTKEGSNEQTQNTRVIQLELERVAMLNPEGRISSGDVNDLFKEDSNKLLGDSLRQNNPNIGNNANSDNESTRLNAEDIAKFNDYVIE